MTIIHAIEHAYSWQDARYSCVALSYRPRRIITHVFLVLTGIIAFGGCGDNRETKWSSSIKESKKRGTFVGEVSVKPRSLLFDGEELAFGEAWLEKRSDGDYALCIKIESGASVFSGPSPPFLVIGDRKDSFTEHHRLGRLQLIEQLDTADLSSIKASLLRTWKDKRVGNISFAYKDKR